MEPLALVAILSMFCYWRRLPLFESVFGLLLILPISTFLVGHILQLSTALYYGALLILLGILVYSANYFEKSEASWSNKEELLPIFVWGISYCLLNYLCLLWPDFFQLGERLRDYALLGSVIHSPIIALEPWQSGANLNYYLYWYRFGHCLHQLFQLPVWLVYHNLQSFTFALFSTSIFVIMRRHAKFSISASLFSAIVISFGSNIEGIRHFYTNNQNWWGPSRVVKGAINEFPAWSFLLGDVHPHYLNLCLIPFLTCLFIRMVRPFKKGFQLATFLLAFLSIGVLWVYNANAWETPVWLIGCGLTFIIFLLGTPKQKIVTTFQQDPGFEGMFKPEILLLLGLAILLSVSLMVSCLNILPGEMPLKYVTKEIGRTPLNEFMLHWGIPISILIATTALAFHNWVWIFASTVVLTISLLSGEAIYLLCSLIPLNIARLVISICIKRDQKRDLAAAVIEGYGLLSLLLITFPEFYFFDDSYGGEIERMNTIFKAYSASWAMLHIYSFWRASQVYSGLAAPKFRVAVASVHSMLLIVVGVISTGFFFKTIQLRKNPNSIVEPRAQGLSEVERKFPGAAETIKILMRQRKGVVLEAQGPAYDYTTHVATLSSQPAYLGWVNHVNLLNRDYQETARRTQLTDDIYKEQNCQNKLKLVKQEGIRFVVLGPLETKAFPDSKVEDFACFQQVSKVKDYSVFEVQ